MSELWLFLGVAVGINVLMFALAFRQRTDKLTDISYTATFAVLAGYGWLNHPVSVFTTVYTVMVLVWAARLGGFLLMRVRKVGKDNRFDGVREDFWKFGRFWLAQGVSVWAILLPAPFVYASDGAQLGATSLLGFVVWAAGLVIEAVADWQKYRFSRAEANKGRWIETGVWRYSRHPNYFGEILVWLGAYLFAVPALSGWGVAIAGVSPVYIATLLLFVSGVPILEKSADERWGKEADYREYKRRTSMVVPWWPRRARASR